MLVAAKIHAIQCSCSHLFLGLWLFSSDPSLSCVTFIFSFYWFFLIVIHFWRTRFLYLCLFSAEWPLNFVVNRLWSLFNSIFVERWEFFAVYSSFCCYETNLQPSFTKDFEFLYEIYSLNILMVVTC